MADNPLEPYDVYTRRDGDWLVVCIPAVDGLTQARDVDEAQLAAREYIAVALDKPISEVQVHLRD